MSNHRHFNPSTDSRDGISRVSCGQAARERAGKPRLAVFIRRATAIAIVLSATAVGVTHCEAAPAAVDARYLGPVCPDFGTDYHSCPK